MPRRSRGLPAASVTLAVVLGLAGCQSMQSVIDPPTTNAAVVETADGVAREVAEVNGRIDDAVRQLNSVLNHPSPDLRRQFDSYAESIEKLNAAEKRLRERAEAFDRQSREYLIEWDRQAATITNESLRTSSAERKQAVTERLDSLRDQLARARDGLAPFVHQLNEMKTALSVDLTAAGVANSRDELDGIRDAAGTAHEGLNNLAGTLRELRVALAERGFPNTTTNERR